MALMYSVQDELGSEAPDFSLPAIDGRTYSLESFNDKKALIVVFMCNHCPYVIAVQDRINDLAKEFGPKGVALIGINPNDPEKYPDDNFEAMKTRSEEKGYVFPYAQDLTQETARAYNAVCTPDPYVYENVDGKFLLRYHGRIDDNWKEPESVKEREMARALECLLSGEPVPNDQKPAMGCSIKWKN